MTQLILEAYVISIAAFYIQCISIFICSSSIKSYTRSKDIKNACMNLERQLKKSVLMGSIWPLWLMKLFIKRPR
jgi:hypothetical protein